MVDENDGDVSCYCEIVTMAVSIFVTRNNQKQPETRGYEYRKYANVIVYIMGSKTTIINGLPSLNHMKTLSMIYFISISWTLLKPTFVTVVGIFATYSWTLLIDFAKNTKHLLGQ